MAYLKEQNSQKFSRCSLPCEGFFLLGGYEWIQTNINKNGMKIITLYLKLNLWLCASYVAKITPLLCILSNISIANLSNKNVRGYGLP